MKTAILVPTVRPDFMATFMASLHFLPEHWRVYATFQGYTTEQIRAIHEGPQGHRLAGHLKMERHPPYLTRALMLQRWIDDVDVWVNCDDDMEILNSVDYDTMAAKAIEPGVGVISGNWVKSPGHMHRARFEDTWIKQPLVNMSGGMCYAKKIAYELLSAPIKPYLFCDVQAAMVSYIAGYENFRYLGSLIIHRIMSKDGLKASYAQRNFDLPEADLLKVEPSKTVYKTTDNNWHMPGSKNLLPRAHELHRERRTALGL